MSATVTTSRREFLLLVTAVLGSAAAGPLGCTTLPDSGEAARRLTGVATEREAWAALGKVYLEKGGDENDLERLTSRLLEDLGDPGLLDRPDDLHKALLERIKTEYREGTTVRVDGWMLAPTEARLCALVALLQETV